MRRGDVIHAATAISLRRVRKQKKKKHIVVGTSWNPTAEAAEAQAAAAEARAAEAAAESAAAEVAAEARAAAAEARAAAAEALDADRRSREHALECSRAVALETCRAFVGSSRESVHRVAADEDCSRVSGALTEKSLVWVDFTDAAATTATTTTTNGLNRKTATQFLNGAARGCSHIVTGLATEGDVDVFVEHVELEFDERGTPCRSRTRSRRRRRRVAQKNFTTSPAPEATSLASPWRKKKRRRRRRRGRRWRRTRMITGTRTRRPTIAHDSGSARSLVPRRVEEGA